MSQQKLYTEEQVINALRLAHSHIKPLQYILDTLTHIELPSYDEAGVIALKIADTLKDKLTTEQEAYFIAGFQTYSKWMKDKILNK